MAKPLKKRTRKRALYTRPPSVESNIDGALGQDTDVLVQRARVTDRASSEYLTSECLVHLIRAAIRSRDESRYNALLPILLARCEANLTTTIRQSVCNAEHIREDVLGELGVLFAEDAANDTSDELDFYECRFDKAFSTLRFDVLNREKVKTKPLVPLSDGSDDGDDCEAPVPPERAKQEDNLFRAELLDALPEDVRKAVVLREMGYKDESEDDSQITIATLCGVSGRAIRDRLKQARQQIQRMNQEEP